MVFISLLAKKRISNRNMSLLGISLINYPRDAMLARVFATATCLSVCLSVTRRYCA